MRIFERTQENADKLRGILHHHVTVSAFDLVQLTDGLDLGMADGGHTSVSRKGSDVFVGDAKIVGSVRGSNGMVQVIDAVILQTAK